ncbi:hypothetical protein GWM83_00685 [Candidatus Bathyarchaeota archaeon]|nr:hypothetical protein [Candidatus Bathyarchaeota archaeon]NIW15968.1 hypothetical protein [Candidatus Bathyarchaeota archaeon]NIW34070.1 hypothetical protein [Candidatus Bathyarchaeota archaeon]
MASWKGELGIAVMGFKSLSLGNFRLEKLKARGIETVRTCPDCHVPVERAENEYRCPQCGTQFKSWYQLERSVKVGEDLKPLPTRDTEKTERASLKLLDLSEVRGLVTKAEYAIVPEDEEGEENLQKLGNMLREYGKVAIFKLCFMKRGRNHVMYLTVSDDGMIMVREIVPLNLVEPLPHGVVFCSPEVDEEEIEELMHAMPQADSEDLSVTDDVIEALVETSQNKDLAKALKKVMIKAE